MNEIAITPEVPNDLTIAREPEVVLREAQRAASCLKDVVAKKEKPIMFNGKQYLQFEDWQTIGKFYGLLCSTLDPKEITIGGVGGAQASAEVVDVRTGKIIGRATAWCLRDEPNWRAKPWFQLSSQAQTRAGAKALRNLLSWVVVLAGYGTTPAEEIEAVAEIAEPVNVASVQAVASAAIEGKSSHPASTEPVRYVSQKQAGLFYYLAKDAGIEGQGLKDFLMDEIGATDTRMIPLDRFEELRRRLQPGQ